MSAKSNDPFDLSAGVPGMQGEMRPKPKFADRISKRVIFAALLFVGILVIIFLVALDNMDKKKMPQSVDKTEATAKKEAENKKVPEELTGDPSGASGSANKSAPASLVASAPQTTTTVPTPGGNNAAEIPGAGKSPLARVPGLSDAAGPTGAIPSNTIPPDAGKVKPLTPEQQAADQAKLERLQRIKQARATGLAGKEFDAGDTAGALAKAGAMPDLSAVNGLLNAAKNSAGQLGQPSQSGGEQDEKLDFIRASAKEDRSYHSHMPVPPVSQNEVKASAYIPMILQQGINSDLPGQVTARVSEGVFDTVTGCRLLIPPMTTVIGKYDSKVAMGQGRNLVVWNGLIFPDGSELNLAGMQAYDPSGQAGMEADVDNHYLRTFGVTLGMSLVGAGVQLSVPQPNPTTGGASQPQTPAQIVAASLSQQFGSLGAQILGKYLAIQPTLRNFPGERFVVMVPRTIVFNKVWRDRCVIAAR